MDVKKKLRLTITKHVYVHPNYSLCIAIFIPNTSKLNLWLKDYTKKTKSRNTYLVIGNLYRKHVAKYHLCQN